jgi:hypothetical protein
VDLMPVLRRDHRASGRFPRPLPARALQLCQGRPRRGHARAVRAARSEQQRESRSRRASARGGLAAAIKVPGGIEPLALEQAAHTGGRPQHSVSVSRSTTGHPSLSPGASPFALVRSSLAQWPTTHAARGCRIGLMQLSASLLGLCSLQPLLLGCAVSVGHVPLSVSGRAAVRSRSDGSGPVDATFAAAFWSA